MQFGNVSNYFLTLKMSCNQSLTQTNKITLKTEAKLVSRLYFVSCVKYSMFVTLNLLCEFELCRICVL